MILVDADVLMSHLRWRPEAAAWLSGSRLDGPLACSVVTVAEITGGMRSAERSEVRRLLGTLHVEPVSEIVGWRAGELRRKYRRSHASIGTVDYLIAATCEIAGHELATLNTKHFPMFKKLRPPFAT